MDLQIRRRHKEKCPIADCADLNHCSCPLYVEGRTEGGARIRRGLGTRSLAVAGTKIAKWNHSADTAIADMNTDVTIAHAIDEFVIERSRAVLAENTRVVQTYVYTTLRTFMERRGIVRLQAITREDINLLLNSLRNREDTGPAKPATVCCFYRYINLWLTWATEEKQWLKENPCSRIRKPKLPKYHAAPYDPEEVKQLVTAARGDAYLCALVNTFLYTGLRNSDIVRLEWRDVDLDTGRLRGFIMQKTQEPVFLTLPQAGRVPLLAWQEVAPDRKRIFVDDNARLRPATCILGRHLRALGQTAKVTGVRPHRFRDTFACTLLDQGTDIRVVQKLLGHNSVTTTENHYAAWRRDQQLIADNAMANLNFSGDTPQSPNPRGNRRRNTKSNVIPLRRRAS